MTVTAKPLYQAAQIPNSITTLYTAPTGTRTIIDKCTFTNTTAGPVTLSVYLVESGDTAGADDQIIATKTLAAGECYTCPEIVGHVLAPGDFLAAIAGAAASITGRISGREVN